MATKSFLTSEEEQEALQRFQPPSFFSPKGESELGLPCSRWLEVRLLHRLAAIDGWREAGPVALGSWSRHELCPKSDIDMVFCGNESDVQRFVGQVQIKGLKLRSRVPEDLADWTIGVEAFDVLAVLQGMALVEEAQPLLQEQKEKIRARGSEFALGLLSAIEREKSQRTARYDSVANYLEPNLKYGPGGLRDLEQALAVTALFAERFPEPTVAQGHLLHYKSVWLALRQYNHLTGGGDILSGPEQPGLAKAFGFQGVQDFMREFQKGISTVNFYANWILAQARRTRRRRLVQLKTVDEALTKLATDPGLLTQAEVRGQVATLVGPGRWSQHFVPTQKEQWFEAVFESHLIDRWLKDVTRLRGLVQHDHYHRFTADAHLLQSIREVIRVRRKPKTLGRLALWAKKLNERDWQILLWTALFHDLAKGLGGDHSSKGVQLVRRELGRMKVSESMIEAVEWMVLRHLALSTAAFRMNVQDPLTWQQLQAQGAQGAELRRLAVFTALDIRATNPDAWNEWKERLLADLLIAMESKSATGLLDLFKSAGPDLAPQLARDIDPAVAVALPARRVISDVRRARRSRKDLDPLAVRNRRGETWVRFHHLADRPGLFLQYVAKLFSLSCSIQQAVARTLPTLGVYDWFQVRTSKTPAQLLRQLNLVKDWTHIEPPTVHLAAIEVISRHEGEAILSFRGRDQKGVLLATARALFEKGFTIRWAKVMTWGSQIDDIFAVEVGSLDLESALATLRTHFSVPQVTSSEVEKSSRAPS